MKNNFFLVSDLNSEVYYSLNGVMVSIGYLKAYPTLENILGNSVGDFSAVISRHDIASQHHMRRFETPGLSEEEISKLMEQPHRIIATSGIREEIGTQLRALREAKGLTTRELAERCGLIHSHIVRIESGRYGFSIDTLSKLCQALGVTIQLTDNSKEMVI